MELRAGAVEELGMSPGFWRGRRVFLTGHTGFKGAWLSLWLRQLGAEVTGYALAPPTEPSLFALAGLETGMASIEADIRDAARLRTALVQARPEVVFHLAAQALVRRSYADPAETFSSNVMGTVHLLDAVRACDTVRGVVVVTSDKCYENRGLDRGYVEDDPLGGHDPYSSSKACTELVAAAYRRSFCSDDVAIATARAGNVIGGGDWAADRLVPDMVRAFAAGTPVRIRNPEAVRPWQHVLEPLAGYLLLAESLVVQGQRHACGWNFGPDADATATVRTVAELAVRAWGAGAAWVGDPGPHPHEAHLLMLDASRARAALGWAPRLTLGQAVADTVEWYRAQAGGADAASLCLEQIARYGAPAPVGAAATDPRPGVPA